MIQRILFVDDDIHISEQYVETLLEAGYEVDLCHDVDGAVERIQTAAKSQYRCCVVDLMIAGGARFSDERRRTNIAVGVLFKRFARGILSRETKIIYLSNFMRILEDARDNSDPNEYGFAKIDYGPRRFADEIGILLGAAE